MDSSRNGPRVLPAGVGGTFELALRFNDWAAGLRVPMTPHLIAKEWGITRSTAYRWLAAYNAAKGRHTTAEAA